MSKTRTKIAILGATSHIACGLISRLLADARFELSLFGRSTARIHHFLGDIGASGAALVSDRFSALNDQPHDVVINCVGAGTPSQLGGDLSAWFTITEEFDNLALSHLRQVNPDAMLIAFSSGAVYGLAAQPPFDDDSRLSLAVNCLSKPDFYTIARLHAEAKHRAMTRLRIADLRIFAYYSRFMSAGAGYFMSDVLRSLLTGTPLLTHGDDMTRDYIAPDDLFQLVLRCLDTPDINGAFDACSAAPVSKSAILKCFGDVFGLRWTIADREASPNGDKNIYYSRSQRATTALGYRPTMTALEGLVLETRARLQKAYRHGNTSP